MIEYLQKLKGTESNQLTEKEKSELEHLRVEIKKYKDIEKHENLEIAKQILFIIIIIIYKI